MKLPLENVLTKDESAAIADLKSMLSRLAGDQLVKIALFGSKARGDYGPESDLDIAIIIKGLSKELKNRILDDVADIELKYLTPMSTLVISEVDFEFLKKRERRIAFDIEREGIDL